MAVNYKFCYVAANVSWVLSAPSDISWLKPTFCALWQPKTCPLVSPDTHGIFWWLLLCLGSFFHWNESISESHCTLCHPSSHFVESDTEFNPILWLLLKPLTHRTPLVGRVWRRWVTGTVCITKMPFHVEYWTLPLGTGHLWLHHTLAAPALGSCLAILFFSSSSQPSLLIAPGSSGFLLLYSADLAPDPAWQSPPHQDGQQIKSFWVTEPTRAGSGGNKKHLLLSTFCRGI